MGSDYTQKFKWWKIRKCPSTKTITSYGLKTFSISIFLHQPTRIQDIYQNFKHLFVSISSLWNFEFLILWLARQIKNEPTIIYLWTFLLNNSPRYLVFALLHELVALQPSVCGMGWAVRIETFAKNQNVVSTSKWVPVVNSFGGMETNKS